MERYPGFSNPFSENIADVRPRSSGYVGTDPLLPPETVQNRLHSPGSSSLVPIARPVASEEEHETIHPDPSVSKTYSFVSLPGNAVRKRPRRRYDEIERLYHCSWTGCTKSYGTLNHLNAHIVMQRHGNKRTPAGEVQHYFRRKCKSNVWNFEQNSKSSGSNGARPRRMKQNVWRGLNELRTGTLCARSTEPSSILHSPMTGRPDPTPIRDSNFTAQGYPVLRWNISWLLAMPPPDTQLARTHRCVPSPCSRNTVTLFLVQLIRSILSRRLRLSLLRGPTTPRNMRVVHLPSLVLPRVILIC